MVGYDCTGDRPVPDNSSPIHMVLIDEADRMTEPVQLAFLSKLDSKAFSAEHDLHLPGERDRQSGTSVPVPISGDWVWDIRACRTGGGLASGDLPSQDRRLRIDVFRLRPKQAF